MWAHWDVEELMTKRKLIESDPELLKLGPKFGDLIE
jgi:hypothetical protein